MTWSFWRLLAVFPLILSATLFGRGQDVAPTPSAVVSPTSPHAPLPEAFLFPAIAASPGRLVTPAPVGLLQIVHAAGIIFSGRVTSVARGGEHAATPYGQPAPSTAITFQVENAIRGASAGQTLTIHEWAGLWARGERYHVGERVLLLLYPPSRLGLTSPVDAGGGRFAIDSHEQIVMSPRNIATLASDQLIVGKTRIPCPPFLKAVQRVSGEE